MKKSILSIILVLALVLSTGITVFANTPDTTDTTESREVDAYAASPFTVKNIIVYDNIEIFSAGMNSRIVLYSGPEVTESGVIQISKDGHINYRVPSPGRYSFTWTDTWGGGWYFLDTWLYSDTDSQ